MRFKGNDNFGFGRFLILEGVCWKEYKRLTLYLFFERFSSYILDTGIVSYCLQVLFTDCVSQPTRNQQRSITAKSNTESFFFKSVNDVISRDLKSAYDAVRITSEKMRLQKRYATYCTFIKETGGRRKKKRLKESNLVMENTRRIVSSQLYHFHAVHSGDSVPFTSNLTGFYETVKLGLVKYVHAGHIHNEA